MGESGPGLGMTEMYAPPFPRAVYARRSVAGAPIDSKAKATGEVPAILLISARMASSERARSRTCVAPRDLRYASCLSEDVVIIGEKQFNLAAWMAGICPVSV